MLSRFFLILTLAFSLNASADFQKDTVIRDAEVEGILRAYLNPLFKVAGLNPKEARIVMVVNNALNAAALPNNTLLFFTGFLLETDTPEEVAGVLAHEVGHMAGRHLVRMYGAMEKAQRMGIFGALMGLAVALMGAPDAGIALALGGSAQSLHTFLHYRRTEEEQADSLGVRYLQKLNWPIWGLRLFLEKLLGQELLSENMQDPYLRTHPLTQDRVTIIRQKEKLSPSKMPRQFYAAHQRMTTKLKAFLWKPERTLQIFKGSSTLHRYAQCIAHYRQSNFKQALAMANTLIKGEPKNPFFWELKGQILFDSGKVKASLFPYERAAYLFPDSALLQVDLARALLAHDQKSLAKKSLIHLKKALALEPDNGMAWQYLAIAHGRLKNMSKMALALAEHALLSHQWDYAIQQAKRAQHFSSKNHPNYRRAEEILKDAQEKKPSKSPFQ